MDDNEALLRTILKNLDQPGKLNNHPWANSDMVIETCKRHPGLRKLASGEQLVQTISIIFRAMMPNTPPKRGLRVDSQWGEFGILASQYFAPLIFHLPYPRSLQEAWQNIDRAILLFVFNNEKGIKKTDRIRYQLIGNEPEIVPNSTIRDWHRKGIKHFSTYIAQYMKQSEVNAKIKETSHSKQSSIIQSPKKLRPTQAFRIWTKYVVLLLIVGLLSISIWKGWGIYQRVRSIKQQTEEIFAISDSTLDSDEVQEISQITSQLRMDLESVQLELTPLLNFSRNLKWIPVYGGDISQAPYILEMMVQISVTGDEMLRAISPLIPVYEEDQSTFSILDTISKLKNVDNELLAAQIAFANAQSARQKIQTDILSSDLYELLNDRIDPFLFSINTAFPISDVLQMARLAPYLLGSAANGEQDYMILIQNEDELRPTGGFLTAVGLLKVENGKIADLSFNSSDKVDDLSKPYPKSPWQLNDYMMAEILLFRDSNWFTNFPTTVEWAKFLYAYTQSKHVDGVITVDQHVVEELLKIIGPVKVSGVEDSISADNVLAYMRSAKEQTPPAGISKNEWDRKQFISSLADALINKLVDDSHQDWKLLSQLLIQLLDEKHILLQFDNPEMSNLLAKRGWDGAVKIAANSDFLMVVDSNIGFNKTNALMQTEINYTVNLADMNYPIANTTVTFTNNSEINPGSSTECIQGGGDGRDLPLDQRAYIMHDCYWSYLRIYTPAGSQLISSTPHEIPQNWSLREQTIPARIDILDEKIDNTCAYGTILVVPKSEILQTNFTYQLPVAVIESENDNKTFRYRLTIQKQPGTLALPLTLHVILPPGMDAVSATSGFYHSQQTGEEWILETDLREDITIEIVFKPSAEV